MDQEAQKRAIIDKLVGAPAGTLPADYDLDEPWRTIYYRVTRAKSHNDAFSSIWFAAQDFENAASLAQELFDLLPDDDEAFTAYPSLHEMSDDFPPVDWLWPSWVPTGVVTLLAAAPGVGKSLVALDLARRVIHGPDFPDGAPVPDPGRNVLIVDAEGAPALLLQRARAWEVDLRRLFLMLPPDPHHPRSRTTFGSATDRRSARFAIDLAQEEQRDRLINMVRSLRPALIVVDSLAAATATGETSLQGSRDLLGFLSMIAQKAHLALLIIHHLRKRSRSSGFATTPKVAADDLRGSSHLSAAARSVLALTSLTQDPKSPVKNPEPSPVRRLEVLKTNLCPLPPPLALIFEGEGNSVPSLRYTEYTEPPPPPTQQDLCARWLLDYLTAAGAPVKPADAIRAAAQEGFPQRTLYRARRALAGAVVDLGNSTHDPNKRWSLASDPSPPGEGTPPQSGRVAE